MALAIYRKYRPATFGEVIGQEPIIAVLKESARQGKLAHAYLFSGPRGTGKTTTARLIAKIANCEKRSADKDFRAQGEPCNACRSCREIDEGRSIDTVEIDAASNRGIDEIRDLKEQVRTTPVSSSSKVFIIDEAHQLTKEAFNALLKTLEEPPAYVVFVLATTEPDRIPATILSRTQQFHFRHVPLENIVQKLTGIAVRESIVISKEALDLIASAAEGSFRDAESLLDQLVAFDGKNVTIREVESMLGNVGFDTLAAFAGFLLSGSTEHALMKLSEIEDGGYNLVQFAKDLIQYVRRVAVLKFNPGMAEVFRREYLAEHVLQLEAHAKLFTDEHLALLKSLIRAYGEMRYSQFPIIPLEVAVMGEAGKRT